MGVGAHWSMRTRLRVWAKEMMAMPVDDRIRISTDGGPMESDPWHTRG